MISKTLSIPKQGLVVALLGLGGVFAQNLTLEAAQARLPQAPDWQSAELSYQTLQRQLESAQAAAGLRINLGGDYNNSQPVNDGSSSSPNGQATVQESQSLKISGSASMTVLPWSANFESIRSAERALYRASLDRRDARNSLAINLSTQYFNLRQASQDLEIAQATLALREQQLRVTTAQNQNGQATGEQVLSSQQNLENARVNLSNTQGNLELSRLQLSNTLGAEVGQASSAPSLGNLPAEALEQLTTQALTRRSDVLKAQSRLEDAQANLSAANLNRLVPDTSISFGWSERTGQSQGASAQASLNFKTGNAALNASSPAYTNPSTTGTYTSSLTLGLSVSLPILAPSSDSAISSAQTAVDSAKLGLDSARRAAALDVRQRYLEAQTARARVEVSKVGLANANQSLETAKAKLTAGTGTALDVENARVNQLQAMRDLEVAQTQALLALLRLQNALGVNLFGGN